CATKTSPPLAFSPCSLRIFPLISSSSACPPSHSPPCSSPGNFLRPTPTTPALTFSTRHSATPTPTPPPPPPLPYTPTSPPLPTQPSQPSPFKSPPPPVRPPVAHLPFSLPSLLHLLLQLLHHPFPLLLPSHLHIHTPASQLRIFLPYHPARPQHRRFPRFHIF